MSGERASYPRGHGRTGPGASSGRNGYAVASLVLGVLWLCWLGSVLAIVFGQVARGQIRQRQQRGDLMALTGIVLGWVGITFLFLFLFWLAARH